MGECILNSLIMTTLKITKPGATVLFDLGVCCKPRLDTTRNMIAAFDSMMGSTIFDAPQASSDDFETSEQNPFGYKYHLRSSRDLVSYSKGAPDPAHHGQAMQWKLNASKVRRANPMASRRISESSPSLRSTLTPQGHVFTSRFHYKIKCKGGKRIRHRSQLGCTTKHVHCPRRYFSGLCSGRTTARRRPQWQGEYFLTSGIRWRSSLCASPVYAILRHALCS